jgi:hypothetical protein
MRLNYKYMLAIRAFILLVAVTLAACTRQVQVDGNWEEGASRDQSFSRVLVIGLSHDINGRCSFEPSMVNQLRYTGVEAKASCNLMDTSEPLIRENIEAVVAEYGADAVLTTVLVQRDVGATAGGDRETRGGLDFKATGTGYSSFYGGGYGAYGVPVVYGEFKQAPVLTSIEGEVKIHSMLYAVKDASLVYELDTTARDLHSRGDALASITPPIAKRLEKAGLLR